MKGGDFQAYSPLFTLMWEGEEGREFWLYLYETADIGELSSCFSQVQALCFDQVQVSLHLYKQAHG